VFRPRELGERYVLDAVGGRLELAAPEPLAHALGQRRRVAVVVLREAAIVATLKT
jgi:hypothetical protein